MIIYTRTQTEPPKDTPETLEGVNLAAHVALCRQRDLTNEKRMRELEEMQDKLERREDELRSYIVRTVSTALLSLLSSAVSLGIMFSEFVKK